MSVSGFMWDGKIAFFVSEMAILVLKMSLLQGYVVGMYIRATHPKKQ